MLEMRAIKLLSLGFMGYYLLCYGRKTGWQGDILRCEQVRCVLELEEYTSTNRLTEKNNQQNIGLSK